MTMPLVAAFVLVVVINFRNINMTWYEMPEMLLNRFSLKLPNTASSHTHMQPTHLYKWVLYTSVCVFVCVCVRMHVRFGWFVRSKTQHNVNEIDRENLFTRAHRLLHLKCRTWHCKCICLFCTVTCVSVFVCVCVWSYIDKLWNSKRVHLCACVYAFIVHILYYCISSTLSKFHSHTHKHNHTHALTNEAWYFFVFT